MAPKGGRIAPYDPQAQQNITAAGPSFQLPELKEHNIIGKRLTQARKQMGMSQKEMSAALEKYGTNVTPGAISKWEKGNAFPGVLQFFAVCDICNINNITEYFLDRSIAASDYPLELSQKGLDILTGVKDALIASGMFTPSAHRKATGAAGGSEAIYMPVLNDVISSEGDISAASLLAESNFTLTKFPASHVPEGADFAVRMHGDSMEPVYIDRQIVWAQKTNTLESGEVGIFICDGSVCIRRYCEEPPAVEERGDYISDGMLLPKICLISFNEAYPPQDVSRQCHFEIVGKILD